MRWCTPCLRRALRSLDSVHQKHEQRPCRCQRFDSITDELSFNSEFKDSVSYYLGQSSFKELIQPFHCVPRTCRTLHKGSERLVPRREAVPPTKQPVSRRPALHACAGSYITMEFITPTPSAPVFQHVSSDPTSLITFACCLHFVVTFRPFPRHSLFCKSFINANSALLTFTPLRWSPVISNNNKTIVFGFSRASVSWELHRY